MNLAFNSQQQASMRCENPQNGWFKLNTDCGVDVNSGNATAGGLVRGPKGDWVLCYGRNLGISSVLEAELQAISDGFKTSWDKGVRRLLIESNSKVTVDLILGT